MAKRQKAKPKATVALINSPIYNTHGMVVMRGEPDECLDRLDGVLGLDPASQKRFVSLARQSQGLTIELMSPKGRKALLIWISPALNLKKPEGVSTVVHECFHVAYRVFKTVGNMKLKDSNEEAYAHFLGWLFKEAMKGLGY